MKIDSPYHLFCIVGILLEACMLIVCLPLVAAFRVLSPRDGEDWRESVVNAVFGMRVIKLEIIVALKTHWKELTRKD